MPRTIRTLAAALAALVIAAPVALARPIDDAHTPSPAATTSSPRQDLWSPGAYPPPPWVPRRDAARPKTPSDVTAALAQERYYSSYGDSEPVTAPASAPEAEPGDGIAPRQFVLGLVGALIVGIAAGGGLHLLHVRRRHATGLAT